MNDPHLLDMLLPIATSHTGWLGFDAAWYSAVNPDAGPDPGAARRHYVEIGRAQARSPNMYFDEAWYRAGNPDIAAAIAAGGLGSGYEHYCTIGYPLRSPHWLYDEETYALNAPDLTDRELIRAGCANRYDHYLKSGARENRIAHLLFQPATYATEIAGAPDAIPEGARSWFQHFLDRLWRGAGDVPSSIYFDPAWYRDNTPAAAGIAAGRYLGALHHFLTAPPAERGEPRAEFSAAFYAAENPAAAALVAGGRHASLYEHFLKTGVFALATPAPGIELSLYLEDSPEARADLESGRVRDAFAHLLGETPADQPAPAMLSAALPLPEPIAPAPPPPVPIEPAATASIPAPVGDMFGDHLFIDIDLSIRCPPDGLVLIGWLLAPPFTLAGLAVICGPHRIALDPARFVPMARADVLDAIGRTHGFTDPMCGFITHVPALLVPGETPLLEITRTSGTIAMHPIPEPKLHGMEAIRALLNRFDLRFAPLASGFDDVIGPAMDALGRAHRAVPIRQDVLDFGPPPADPEVSVIIPLYGRVGLMEYQLALFSRHRPGVAHELIYVLDDPARRRETEELATSLFARFALPFRLVLLSRNTGYAPANNIGLALARGAHVCLMNSDVFPRDADWLARLLARLRATPGLAAIGPLLLFEDDSVQHQGMSFEPLPEFAGWSFPIHDRKGRRPPPQRGLHEARAITGACILIARATLADLGNLDETYLIGDFEDADLCLRLASRGLRCAVDLDVALYHLERQSQAAAAERWRMNLTLYNAWQHQRRWAPTLAGTAA